MSIRIAAVVGARPEFVQVGTLARAFPAYTGRIDPILIHTGQHYDANMSQDFFDRLGLPRPDHTLGVGSGGQGVQTGQMLALLDPLLQELEPDVVIVFGDTNSTLAGALAAAKLHIPVAHVESGLRSFNLRMPEEVNRRLTDHMASILFCPSPNAVANLASEGITDGIHLTGDVMFESLQHTLALVGDGRTVLDSFGLVPGSYALATVHRSENTDDPERLSQIVLGLADVAADGLEVIFPVHPRTRQRLDRGLAASGVRMIDPVGHPEAMALARDAAVVLTDSGGLQKETYWLGTPCVTMRDETEWVETVEAGWNRLAGADRNAILQATRFMTAGNLPERVALYGEGTKVSHAILDALIEDLERMEKAS